MIRKDALLSDQPIKSAAEDALGLQPFAASLAKSLYSMAPAEGMVIALHAPWGSGKTSVLNLVERHLAVLDLADSTKRPSDELADLASARDAGGSEAEGGKANEWDKLLKANTVKRRTAVIRFNPWYFSDQEDLFRAFFGVLSTELELVNETAVANAFRSLLKRGADAGTAAGAAAGLVAGGPAGAAGGSMIGRWFGSSLSAGIEHLESLEATLKRIRAALQQSSKRFVVFIDDIDRLSPKDAQHMLALIKSVGNLPKLTYLLAYDQKEVLRLLDSAHAGDVRYLEKIVQASFGMPKVDHYALRALLFSKLDTILAGAEIDIRRWTEAYYLYIDRYLQTPRHVNRLANSLRVIWPAVANEVDWSDLVTLEVLRLHEAKLFALIQEKLDLLTGEDQMAGLNEDWRKSLKPTPENSSHPQLAEKALIYLFPRLAESLGRPSSGYSDATEDRRNRRLRCPDYAGNYFSLAPAKDQFSASEIRAFLKSTTPEAHLEALLLRANTGKTRRGLTMVSRLLEQIAEEISFTQPLVPEVARVLIKSSSQIIAVRDTDSTFCANDNERRLEWVFLNGLQAIHPVKRVNQFLDWLPGVEGLSSILPLLEELTSKEKETGDQIFPAKEFERLRAKMTFLVEEAAHKGDWIIHQPNLAGLLFAWSRLSGADAVSKYLLPLLESEEVILKLIAAMPSEVNSSREGLYYHVSKTSWETLVPLDVVCRRVSEIKQKILDQDSAAIIERFESALKRYRHEQFLRSTKELYL